MNTIIWIGLFMFVMGIVILVSSYQKILDKSAKAGGIISALFLYLIFDGIAAMIWGSGKDYIMALLIGGLGLIFPIVIVADVIKSRNKSDDEYRQSVEDASNMRPGKVLRVEQEGAFVRVYMKVYRGTNITSGRITFLTQSSLYKEGDMYKVLYPRIEEFHPGLEKEFSPNRIVDVTGIDETVFKKLNIVERVLIGDVMS